MKWILRCAFPVAAACALLTPHDAPPQVETEAATTDASVQGRHWCAPQRGGEAAESPTV